MSLPFRADGGMQSTTQASWGGASGVPGLYYNSVTGWMVRKPDNSEVAFPGAGGSTGNWSFTTNDADRSSSGVLTIGAGGNCTSLGIGSSALNSMSLTGARFAISQRALTSGTQNSAFLVTGGAHTALTASTELSDVDINLARTVQWATGALTTQRFTRVRQPTAAFVGASTISDAATLAIDGPPVAGTNATITRSWALWLQAGNLGMAPATSISNASQGATNTTGLTLASNVADGASSIATLFNSTTALATDGAYAYQFQNAGANRFTIGRASSAWKFTFFGDTDGTGSGPVLIKSTSASAGITLDATTAGGRIYQQYSTTAGLYVIADISAALNRWQMDSSGNWAPFADNSYTLGLAANRNKAVFSYWYDTKMGAQLTAASTITPTAAIHHVTGATTINLIALTNVPASSNVFITLIADSTITFGSSASAGGIKVAPGTTLASGKAMSFVLDTSTSLWYPEQGA